MESWLSGEWHELVEVAAKAAEVADELDDPLGTRRRAACSRSAILHRRDRARQGAGQARRRARWTRCPTPRSRLASRHWRRSAPPSSASSAMTRACGTSSAASPSAARPGRLLAHRHALPALYRDGAARTPRAGGGRSGYRDRVRPRGRTTRRSSGRSRCARGCRAFRATSRRRCATPRRRSRSPTICRRRIQLLAPGRSPRRSSPARRLRDASACSPTPAARPQRDRASSRPRRYEACPTRNSGSATSTRRRSGPTARWPQLPARAGQPESARRWAPGRRSRCGAAMRASRQTRRTRRPSGSLRSAAASTPRAPRSSRRARWSRSAHARTRRRCSSAACLRARRLRGRRYRDEAARELDELGRPAPASHRRSAGNGLEALTARERQIAELVADGRRNREIADELFVSSKTVEKDLARVFEEARDLDARGRRRGARAGRPAATTASRRRPAPAAPRARARRGR